MLQCNILLRASFYREAGQTENISKLLISHEKLRLTLLSLTSPPHYELGLPSRENFRFKEKKTDHFVARIFPFVSKPLKNE